MRATIVSLIVFHAAAFARPQDEATRDFQKSVAVKRGQRVEIDHRLGSVIVRATQGSQASIKASIRASAANRDDAQRLADQIEIIVDDKGSTILIRTRYPDNNNRRYGRNVSFSANFDISLPESSPLVVRNRFGGIDVDGMKARVEIYGGHGTINLSNARGDHYVENHFGRVAVRGNQGSVNIANNNGPVTVEDVSGLAEVRNRFGEIRVSKIGGELRVTGGHGNVQVRDVAGRVAITNVFSAVRVDNAKAGVSVDNQNGSVEMNDIACGAHASTTFGRLTLRNLAGRVDASSRNGGVDLTLTRGCNPVMARSSFGNVRVTVPPDGNYDVFAQTTFGTIHSDLPLTVSGHLSSRSLQGKIGSGGCKLDLVTRNGNVEIRR